jgi:hypothetical protein
MLLGNDPSIIGSMKMILVTILRSLLESRLVQPLQWQMKLWKKA